MDAGPHVLVDLLVREDSSTVELVTQVVEGSRKTLVPILISGWGGKSLIQRKSNKPAIDSFFRFSRFDEPEGFKPPPGLYLPPWHHVREAKKEQAAQSGAQKTDERKVKPMLEGGFLNNRDAQGQGWGLKRNIASNQDSSKNQGPPHFVAHQKSSSGGETSHTAAWDEQVAGCPAGEDRGEPQYEIGDWGVLVEKPQDADKGQEQSGWDASGGAQEEKRHTEPVQVVTDSKPQASQNKAGGGYGAQQWGDYQQSGWAGYRRPYYDRECPYRRGQEPRQYSNGRRFESGPQFDRRPDRRFDRQFDRRFDNGRQFDRRFDNGRQFGGPGQYRNRGQHEGGQFNDAGGWSAGRNRNSDGWQKNAREYGNDGPRRYGSRQDNRGQNEGGQFGEGPRQYGRGQNEGGQFGGGPRRYNRGQNEGGQFGEGPRQYGRGQNEGGQFGCGPRRYNDWGSQQQYNVQQKQAGQWDSGESKQKDQEWGTEWQQGGGQMVGNEARKEESGGSQGEAAAQPRGRGFRFGSWDGTQRANRKETGGMRADEPGNKHRTNADTRPSPRWKHDRYEDSDDRRYSRRVDSGAGDSSSRKPARTSGEPNRQGGAVVLRKDATFESQRLKQDKDGGESAGRDARIQSRSFNPGQNDAITKLLKQALPMLDQESDKKTESSRSSKDNETKTESPRKVVKLEKPETVEKVEKVENSPRHPPKFVVSDVNAIPIGGGPSGNVRNSEYRPRRGGGYRNRAGSGGHGYGPRRGQKY